MAEITQGEWEAFAEDARQTRRITASGQIQTFNFPFRNEQGEYIDDEGTPVPVYYIDSYLGKPTRIIVDSRTDTSKGTAVQAYARRFPGGEFKAVDDKVQENSATLSVSADQALANATDACAVMGTLGGLSPDLGSLAFNAEKAAGEMLSAVTEVAGVVGEVVSAVSTVIAEVTSILAEAGTILAELLAAGLTELYQALSDVITEVTSLVEVAAGGLNEAIGEVADDIAGDIASAVTTVGAAIEEAGSLVGDLVGAVSSGNCKTVATALAALPVTPPGNAAETVGLIKETQPQQSRMLKTDGSVVGFNIDKKLPYADIQYRGKLTRMYYQDAEAMQKRFGTLGTGNLLAGNPLDIAGALGAVGGALA